MGSKDGSVSTRAGHRKCRPQVTWPPRQSPPSQQGGQTACPPGRHSAPTPVDTTAVSRLLADLIAGVVGVVRPLKRPRDKEAVDLGSAHSTTTAHLVQPDVLRAELQVPVLGYGHWAQPQPLGELRLLLGSVDLQHVLERWQQLGPLGTAQPYVKVQLMLLQRKWKKRKMSSRKGTVAPYFNEAFTFHVPLSQIQFRAEPKGKVLLGAQGSSQPLQRWVDVLASA
ncbi:Synaptotagmin-8 [Manis javanica]|nr:Synaptotagmin-8 [Manis javanica]